MIKDLKVIETTLQAGDTTVLVNNENINDNSIIEIYTDDFSVFPISIIQENRNLSITFEKQINDIGIKIFINNIDDTLPVPEKISDLSDYDTSVTPQTGYGLYWNGAKWQPGTMYEEYDNLINRPKINNVVLAGGNNTAESLGLATTDDIDEIDNDISDIDAELLDIQSSKQDKLTAGENITIENNIISAAGGGSTGEIYDDTESVIGTWFGKPLYRRCFIQTEELYGLNGSTWKSTEFLMNNCILHKVSVNVKDGNGYIYYPVIGYINTSTHYFTFMHTRNSNVGFTKDSIFIFEYTKVGD